MATPAPTHSDPALHDARRAPLRTAARIVGGLVVAALLLTGCGDDDGSNGTGGQGPTEADDREVESTDTSVPGNEPSGDEDGLNNDVDGDDGGAQDESTDEDPQSG